MTNLGDLLGNMADKLAQDNLNVGDVHLLNLDQKNGITPKAGDATRNNSLSSLVLIMKEMLLVV